jgi:hypothetical protein
LRRATHRATAVTLLKKSVFNLRIDPMEPLLSSLGSFLIGGDLCLQLRDPIFSGTHLIRELLRHVHRVPAVLLGNISSFVQKLEDRLTGFVDLTVVVSRTLSRIVQIESLRDSLLMPLPVEPTDIMAPVRRTNVAPMDAPNFLQACGQ